MKQINHTNKTKNKNKNSALHNYVCVCVCVRVCVCVCNKTHLKQNALIFSALDKSNFGSLN